MKKKFDVLIIDSRYKHSLTAVRNLGTHGLKIITGSNKFSPTKFSIFSKKSFKYKNNDFEKTLLWQLKKYDVELVIPIDYKSNIKCSNIKNEIKKYSNIFIEDYSKMSMAASKELIINILEKTKISYPKSYIIKKKNDINKISGFNKLVIKSIEEERGKKVEYVKSKKELLSKINERMIHGPQIIQEYIEGFGCGYFALCHNGEVVQDFQHKRIRQYPETGGVSSVATSFYDKKLTKYGKELIKKLNWTGVCMIEFIYNEKNKEFYFIEFNPKFWGSLDLSISCGIDFPYLLYKIAKEEKIIKQEYETGKRFQWVLPEDTIRIKTSLDKKQSRKDWRKDFFSKKTKTDFGYIIKDPIPTLIRIIGTLYGMIKK